MKKIAVLIALLSSICFCPEALSNKKDETKLKKTIEEYKEAIKEYREAYQDAKEIIEIAKKRADRVEKNLDEANTVITIKNVLCGMSGCCIGALLTILIYKVK